LSTFGFLGYPVLQAADIIIYKANAVPVGIDQVPHVEITREIARRFNFLYDNVFPEPESILTETPKILGLDRRKMSKSYDNAIYLSDTEEAVSKKVSSMVTDPQRARRSDPGNPDECNVFEFHRQYSDPEQVKQIDPQCRKAEIGCVECKKQMAVGLNEALAPVREKRAYYEERPGLVADIIEHGNAKAREVAQASMAEVRKAVKI
jgi:tryptophanyl-tRNA synthetase